jgi:hypothetical protein
VLGRAHAVAPGAMPPLPIVSAFPATACPARSAAPRWPEEDDAGTPHERGGRGLPVGAGVPPTRPEIAFGILPGEFSPAPRLFEAPQLAPGSGSSPVSPMPARPDQRILRAGLSVGKLRIPVSGGGPDALGPRQRGPVGKIRGLSEFKFARFHRLPGKFDFRGASESASDERVLIFLRVAGGIKSKGSSRRSPITPTLFITVVGACPPNTLELKRGRTNKQASFGRARRSDIAFAARLPAGPKRLTFPHNAKRSSFQVGTEIPENIPIF